MMIAESAAAAGIFLVMEVAGLFLFRWLRLALPGERETGRWFDIETVKGVLERLMLYAGLLMGYPHVLTLFAAVKLANRMSDESPDHDEMKNYFLVGNLVSVLMVLFAVLLVRSAVPALL
jgi:hypothetical protein